MAIGGTDASREFHSRALQASREVGIPAEEARSLEGLAHCQLRAGDDAAAIAGLNEALNIYQKIGAVEAAAVTGELAKLANPATGDQSQVSDES